MFGVAGAIVLGFRKEPLARLVSKSFLSAVQRVT